MDIQIQWKIWYVENYQKPRGGKIRQDKTTPDGTQTRCPLVCCCYRLCELTDKHNPLWNDETSILLGKYVELCSRLNDTHTWRYHFVKPLHTGQFVGFFFFFFFFLGGGGGGVQYAFEFNTATPYWNDRYGWNPSPKMRIIDYLTYIDNTVIVDDLATLHKTNRHQASSSEKESKVKNST